MDKLESGLQSGQPSAEITNVSSSDQSTSDEHRLREVASIYWMLLMLSYHRSIAYLWFSTLICRCINEL